jgi:SAM-dependent methyltransferase
MHVRSNEKEYIDLGPSYYSKEEYHDCLRQLGRIGRILGGNRASLLAFRKYCPQPDSILDVGCGGGDFACYLAKKFPYTQVVGIDTSAEAITYARQKSFPNLSFEHRDIPELREPENSYDVVTATLMCHHLSDEELVLFLKQAAKTAKKWVIINDLHRHVLAYGSFAAVSPVLFPNRLIRHDGLLSVKRGFIKMDWEGYCAKAGLCNFEIIWRMPFRWVVTIKIT